MAKTTSIKTAMEIQSKNTAPSDGQADTPKKSRSRRLKGVSNEELMGIVCNLFCEGAPIGSIKAMLKAKGIDVPRERPYRLMTEAALEGRLQYVAPMDAALTGQLIKNEAFEFLQGCSVVRTGSSVDVAYEVARVVLRMLKEDRKEYLKEDGKREIHIGFAGGHLLRRAAAYLSRLMNESDKTELPDRLYIHSLCAGLAFHDATSQPNAFFTYFNSPAVRHAKTEVNFVGFPAPGLVRPAQVRELRDEYDDVRYAFEQKEKIQIVVTSAGGCWTKGHSALHKMYLASSPSSIETLNKANCIGDMMWRPLGNQGPIKVKTEKRAMTLFELEELPDVIEEGKRVILCVAPCGQCGTHKGSILKTIMGYGEHHYITHLVADSLSVRNLMKDFDRRLDKETDYDSILDKAHGI